MLLTYTMKLREMGKQLEDERALVAQIKSMTGWRKRRAFARKMRIYETKTLLAEREFMKMEMEVDYYKKVEPMKYTCKLILGVFAILLSLNWLA